MWIHASATVSTGATSRGQPPLPTTALPAALPTRVRLRRRLLRSRTATVGGTLLILLIAVAAIGPVVAPNDPLQASLRERLQAPSPQHWFGTDALGRDILSRLLHGARVSMLTGVVVGLLGLAAGVPIGLVAGYGSGRIDELLMRAMDVLLAFPGVLLAIAIVGVLGPGLLNAMVAIGIVAVPSFARVARAATLRTRAFPFVEAARACGAADGRIITRHILPNITSPLLVLFSLRVATAILTGSALGFLGLGVQPPEAEWGAMLSDGRDYLRTAPHVAMIPGFAITLVVLAFNLLGDGLRDALDPQMKQTTSRPTA